MPCWSAEPRRGAAGRQLTHADRVQALLGTPTGAAIGWAHFIAFDLFVGRWEYLDARRRSVHPLVMAPVLLLTILLAPLGMLVYLAVRAPAGPAAPGGSPSRSHIG
jgi:hypothetical protein